MKKIVYILIGLFILCGLNSYGQRSGSVSATKKSSKKSKRNRDAFKGKSRKGPNVYSSGGRSKNRSKAYSSSVGRKKTRNKGGGGFNSKKKRYKFINTKPQKGDQGSRSSKGGRKSGKGRKK